MVVKHTGGGAEREAGIVVDRTGLPSGNDLSPGLMGHVEQPHVRLIDKDGHCYFDGRQRILPQPLNLWPASFGGGRIEISAD